MSLALFVLRVVVGFTFVGHGAQKLYGSFGGDGPDRTAALFDQVALRPGRFNAMAAGCCEFLGGLALAFGFLTPFAAAALVAVMTAAIITVHARNGYWNTNKGFEYNLVLIAVA